MSDKQNIQVVLHQQWQPPSASGYGEKCRTKGVVLFLIGTILLDARYNVFDECLTLHVAQVKPPDKRYALFNEVGFNFPKDFDCTKDLVEELLERELAEVLTVCIDG